MYISKHFTYDANGTPLTVTFDYACFMDERTYDETTGTFLDDTEICYTISDTYYYITNIQGDVIELLNSDGESAGYYRYDAWGNIIDMLDNEDVIYYNPLRYRGYFLDPVSNLYYLQTRFYDPSVGRFISAEPNVFTGGFDEGAGVIGYNVFAYCANNPVILVDYNGEFVIAATAYIFTISLVDIISITVSVLVTVEAINYIETTLSGTYFASSKGRSKSEVDPYARPNQKKQGRENKNKNRQKSNYTPRNNRRDGKPAPPKHHTPSSDHQKFSQTRKTKLSMVYKRLG